MGAPDVCTQLFVKRVPKMKATERILHPRENSRPANRQAHSEIQSFLQALHSYPDRFSREPDVSFEQHMSSLDKGLEKGEGGAAG